MPKRVLDIGNCGPDHSALKNLLQRHFAVSVVQAHGLDDAIECLRKDDFDLVTVNRLMDGDGSEGLSIIQAIKRDHQFGSVPVMMITNFPEHDARAIRSGAVPGFGKQGLGLPETIERLAEYLA